LHK
jgi:hypothetical protein